MTLSQLSLTNFRNHHKRELVFSDTTIIIGKNTAGKTNILEAVNYLSLGKSFKADLEADIIQIGEEFARVEAQVQGSDPCKLSILFNNQKRLGSKKYLVNDVARRVSDFVSHFTSVLFTPEDIEIISGSPGSRRRYIDSILYKAHKQYRVASSIYEKALRHRNRMLRDCREGRKRYPDHEFDYWNNLLIEHGGVITQFREDFVSFVNQGEKTIFDFDMEYDVSTVTEARFLKYYQAERGAGITLIGPQRDDFSFYYPRVVFKDKTNPHPNLLPEGEGNQRKSLINDEGRAIREYGSRGEQRLTLLQLKLFEIEYLKKHTERIPTLLLDDIFSELDDKNIDKVYNLIPLQQTIITTTHKEFVPNSFLTSSQIEIIEL